MRSSKSEHGIDETRNILFYCILCKQKIRVSKDSSGAAVAFDEKGLLAETINFEKPTLCHQLAEGSQPIGFYEYQIADDVRRYVPHYSEQDRAKAKQFWQKDWDGDFE
jgi:hypothetical protein